MSYVWPVSFNFYFLILVQLWPRSIVEGAQKLQPWLGDPSWITGTTPPSRFFNGFVSYRQDLYLYGGATSVTGCQNSYFGLFDAHIIPVTNSKFTEALGDMHHFETASSTWTDLTMQVEGDIPGPRFAHGFTATSEDIYVYGGATDWSSDAPRSGEKKNFSSSLRI